jgi:hypothetical protein
MSIYAMSNSCVYAVLVSRVKPKKRESRRTVEERDTGYKQERKMSLAKKLAV